MQRNINELTSSLNKLKQATRRLQLSSAELQKITKTSAFSYDEYELIRRVFKSVKSSIKGKEDQEVANSILEKTEWIEKGMCLDD
jgi:tRNA C32,U32 (ribose-2'-O)-methylase TrmJ